MIWLWLVGGWLCLFGLTMYVLQHAPSVWLRVPVLLCLRRVFIASSRGFCVVGLRLVVPHFELPSVLTGLALVLCCEADVPICLVKLWFVRGMH